MQRSKGVTALIISFLVNKSAKVTKTNGTVQMQVYSLSLHNEAFYHTYSSITMMHNTQT